MKYILITMGVFIFAYIVYKITIVKISLKQYNKTFREVLKDTPTLCKMGCCYSEQYKLNKEECSYLSDGILYMYFHGYTLSDIDFILTENPQLLIKNFKR